MGAQSAPLPAWSPGGSSRFDPGEVRAPLLTVYAGSRDPEAVSLEVIEGLTASDRRTAAIPDATHGDFSDDVLLESVLDLGENEARSTEAGRRAYGDWLDLLTEFLNGAFEGRGGQAAERAAKARGLVLTRRPAGGG